MKSSLPVTAAALLLASLTPPASAHDWTGFYSGYNASRSDNRLGHTDHYNTQGGVHAGYNLDIGGFVLGGEAEAKLINTRVGGIPINDSVAVKTRLGVDLGGVLVYGTVGMVRASVEMGGLSVNEEGSVYGFGTVQRLSRHWSLGMEVLCSGYRHPLGGDKLTDTSAAVKLNFQF